MKMSWIIQDHLRVLLFCSLCDLVKPCGHVCQGLLEGGDDVGVRRQLGGEVHHLVMLLHKLLLQLQDVGRSSLLLAGVDRRPVGDQRGRRSIQVFGDVRSKKFRLSGLAVR